VIAGFFVESGHGMGAYRAVRRRYGTGARERPQIPRNL